MVAIAHLLSHLRSQHDTPQQYRCSQPINLYASEACESLVTQVAAGRQLWVVADAVQLDAASQMTPAVIPVRLCEDDYPGLLSTEDVVHLAVADQPYESVTLSTAQIQARLPQVLDFSRVAMAQPNEYLWGGTVGPNFDCSGLVQTAFAASGIWLPRDAYQQEAFTQSVALDDLQPGDLIFFGNAEKVTHVGIHLGDGRYIHSSGRDQGHNGIDIDSLGSDRTPVGDTYYQQLWGAGRVIAAYQPQGSAVTKDSPPA